MILFLALISDRDGKHGSPRVVGETASLDRSLDSERLQGNPPQRQTDGTWWSPRKFQTGYLLSGVSIWLTRWIILVHLWRFDGAQAWRCREEEPSGKGQGDRAKRRWDLAVITSNLWKAGKTRSAKHEKREETIRRSDEL